MSLTQKDLNFVLKKKLPPIVIHLWEWLKEFGEGKDHEIDFRDFNQRIIKKRGKPYSDRWIKTAIEMMANAGIIVLGRKYHWAIWDVFLVPHPWYKEREKQNFQQWNFGSKGFGRKPQSTDDKVIQQQHKIQSLLGELNLSFSPKTIARLVKFGIRKIKAAIMMYRERSKTSPINNPQGWIIDCVRNEYWLDYCANLDALGV